MQGHLPGWISAYYRAPTCWRRQPSASFCHEQMEKNQPFRPTSPPKPLPALWMKIFSANPASVELIRSVNSVFLSCLVTPNLFCSFGCLARHCLSFTKWEEEEERWSHLRTGQLTTSFVNTLKKTHLSGSSQNFFLPTTNSHHLTQILHPTKLIAK